MESLNVFDKISCFKFGQLNIDFNVSYLKFDSEFDQHLYISTNDETCDLMMFQPIEDEFVLKLENIELVMKALEVYFLKPAPSEHIDESKCKIKRFKLKDNLTENVSIVSDQLDFIRERSTDILRSQIGTRRLKLTCWPFKNLKLQRFLKECLIPYICVLDHSHSFVEKDQKQIKEECYLFDETLILWTNYEDEHNGQGYQLKNWFSEIKGDKIKANGFLFQKNESSFSKLEIILQYYHVPTLFNGKSIDDGPRIDMTSNEPAFIIFNTETPLVEDQEEIVLPLSVRYEETSIFPCYF
jgi:hypothetical protein